MTDNNYFLFQKYKVQNTLIGDFFEERVQEDLVPDIPVKN